LRKHAKCGRIWDRLYLERTFNWYKDARKFCPGILSASGYYLLNDSDGAVLDADNFPVERNRPGYQDWYFFAYGTDYRQALADFRLLSGAAPLPPYKALGLIFSRWPAFTGEEIETLVRDFRAQGYPLSTLVMDMEWHKEGWGHWEFNPDLIPDPARFFARCKELGLDVTFNDHPLDVRDDDAHFDDYVRQAGPEVEVRERDYNGKTLRMAKVDICNKQQNQAFSQVCHQAILDLGLDYWWNDGSRGQMCGTSGQLVANKTFFEEAERDGRRGMLLARYGGLGSHRYGGFFTGDTTSDFHVLRLQCEFNIRAGGVGLSAISHDIGGFCLAPSQLTNNAEGEAIINPELYLRWLQFGVFNPMLRFHCAPGSGSRKPYDYDSALDGACRHWLRVRHSLLPYLYTAVYQHAATGIPVTRGLFLDDQRNPAAYRFDEYYFGPDLLVAPVLSADAERTLYLPAGDWWEFETATRVTGGSELTRTIGLHEVPVYVRAGSILPRQDPDGEIHQACHEHLWLDCYPGADGEAFLYEDDGVTTRHREGAYCLTRFSLTQTGQTIRIVGQVVDGTPLLPLRCVTLTISLPTPPVAITLHTGELLPWEELGSQRYRVLVPACATDTPFDICITTACL
jgi:alpha-glucosidase (family GH31 glycosyl hydrolase)